jgi:hypothetical protein
MLDAAVWSALAGLAALCVLEFAAAFAGDACLLSGLAAVALAASVAALTAAAAGILAVAVAPDDAALARLGDRQFLLQERFSTALETANAGATLDPVGRALLADAERCAGRIDARQWFTLRLPRLAWAVPALTGVALLLSLLQPGALGRAAVTAETGPAPNASTFTSRQSTDTADDLRRIADVLAADAEKESDPYLRTIARSLERLSEEVHRGAADRRSVAAELDRLLQHVRRASAQDVGQARQTSGTNARPSPADLIQTALDNVVGKPQAHEVQPAERDAANSSPMPQTAPKPAGAQPAPAPPSPRKTAGLATSEPAMPSSLPPGWANVLDSNDDPNGVEDPRAQVERALAEQWRRMRGGQSAGAAQDAGQGEGDRAGIGTRPLGNGAGAAANLPTAGDLLLPDQSGNGGRIRIEIPPEAVHAEVAPPPEGVGSEWPHLREEAIDRPAPSLEERKALGRYFMRSAGGQSP